MSTSWPALLVVALVGCRERQCVASHQEVRPGYTQMLYCGKSCWMPRRVPPRTVTVCDRWFVPADPSPR